MMLALEVRTFEQRFGARCPLCGESWGSPKKCDPNPGSYSIRDSLRLLFADKVRACDICARQVTGNRKFCEDCAAGRRQSGNRHAWRMKTCGWCSATFRTQKKGQRFCSLSCGNLSRHRGTVQTSEEKAMTF